MHLNVRKLTVFPVKSLPGIEVQSAEVASKGHLLHDRRYAIFNMDGTLVNGKREPLIHRLDFHLDFSTDQARFENRKTGEYAIYCIKTQRKKIDYWLSKFFGRDVVLKEDQEGGFLDDPDISHVTLVSAASLQRVTDWFDLSSDEECRARFRANIVMEGFPAFREDMLFRADKKPVLFRIGDVTIHGMQPRPRCVVPSRHPASGEELRGFQKRFTVLRKQELDRESHLLSYGHAYHLAVDLMIPSSEAGKSMHVGDRLDLL